MHVAPEYPPDVRTVSGLSGPAACVASRWPHRLSRVAAVAVWLVIADVVIAAGGYLAAKSGSSVGATAAYAAGHVLGAVLLLAAWRGRSLVRRARALFTTVTSHLTRVRAVLLFVAAVTLLRLAWVLLVPTQPTSDHAVYHGLAVRLAETGVYDTEKHRAYWPPGYPAFLAALYAVFGPAVLIGKLGNVVLAGLADLLSWRLVRTHVGPGAATAALLLTAAWPGRNFHVDVLSYDELVLVLLLASLVLLPGPADVRGGQGSTRPLRWLAAGLVLGLACLVRPTLGVTPVAVGAWLLLRGTSWRRAALCTALYGAAMLVPIVPWTARNYAVLGRFVPLTTNAGGNFYNSWAPGGTGDFHKPAWEHLHAVTGGDELLLSPVGFRLGLAAIREDPLRAAWRVAQKQVHYLGSDNWMLPVECYTAALRGDARGGAVLKTALHTLTNGWYLLLLLWPVVGLRGLARRFEQRPLAGLCLGLFLLGLIIHTVFEAQPRYHLIYLPFWGIMLAVLGTADAAQRRHVRTVQHRAGRTHRVVSRSPLVACR